MGEKSVAKRERQKRGVCAIMRADVVKMRLFVWLRLRFGSSGASAPDPFRCACVVQSEVVQEDWHLGAFP